MPRSAPATPVNLRPFLFHGLDLQWRDGQAQAVADCPFCGREEKLSVEVATGLWRCFVCAEGSEAGGGNALTFLRLLWAASDAATGPELADFASELGILYPDSLMRWGVCRSMLSPHWLVPGYSADGKVNQLYKYTHMGDRWTALPTPEMHHQLHGVVTYEQARHGVHLCEGWKDGVAWWEALKYAKEDGGGYRFTASELSSVLGDVNVLAVQSCGMVGRPLEKFLPLFAGKVVTLMFDSDHPKARCADCHKSWSTVEHKVCPECKGDFVGPIVPPAGFMASQRVAAILSRSVDPPKEILWVKWGPDGYDPSKKDGWDVRDELSGSTDGPSRAALVRNVMQRVEPVPAEWLTGVLATGDVEHASRGMATLACSEWSELKNSWSKAMRMRQELYDVLAVMMSVSLSTEQVGDQLFLQVIGEAGTGKTRLCDAMLISRNCFALEHLTGFHSGFKDSSGESFSLLARINKKTLITPEGDVLMSSPRFPEIMSQQRRIFDGTSGASFKNSRSDDRYTGLRTPWIMAGTPALLNTDQSRLGDRFLRVIINPPDDEEKTAIVRRVGYTALQSVLQTSDGKPETHVNEQLGEAYRRTGGYVDWLRSGAPELLARVGHDAEWVIGECGTLAEFTALLRARPDPDHKKDVHDSSELPTRLQSQFVRLAACLAVVLNRWYIDEECLRIVNKVALDTAKGATLNIARTLYSAEPRQEGLGLAALSIKIRSTDERTATLLRFLRQIRVVEMFDLRIGRSLHRRYRLTRRMTHLYERATGVTASVSHVGVTNDPAAEAE